MRSLVRLASWLLLAMLVHGIDSPASAAPRAPDCGAKVLKSPGKAWQCTFVDDFDGAALDDEKWRPLTTANSNLHGGDDCWVDSSENIAVSDGNLRLTSRREDSPVTCTTANGTSFDSQVTSGSVSTFGKFAQTYGRWDIRARFPEVTLPGSQGSLWLAPQQSRYGVWPLSGEIDIAESFSLYPDRVVPHIHYKPSSTDSTVTNTKCLVSDPWNFHTYSAVWTPGRIVISIDDRTCLDHKVHAADPLSGSQPFDQEFVLNLTQTLGVATNTPVEGMPMPLTTEVDYVRVWR